MTSHSIIASRRSSSSYELPNININTGSSSSGNSIANILIGTLLTGASTALLGGVKGSSTQSSQQTAEAKAAAEQQAIIAQYSNSKNIQSEIKTLTTQLENIKNRKAELEKLNDGTTEQKVKTLTDEINKLNNKTYNNNNITLKDVAEFISQRDSAISTKKNLEATFTSDKAIISQNQSIASSNIASISVFGNNLIIPIIDSQGNVEGSSFSQQYQTKIAQYQYKTPPIKKSNNYAKNLKDYNDYLVALSQQAEVTAKDAEVQRKSNAIKQLNTYKATYGDNLDGTGGTYANQIKTCQDTITQINNLEQKNSDAFADYNTRTLKISEKNNAEALIKSYTQTTKKNGDQDIKLNKTVIQAKINKCEEQIKKITETIEKLNNLMTTNSNISNLEQVDKTSDENDGNWFTRLFSKGKRETHKTRKGTQAIIAEQKQFRQQEIINMFKEIAEMETKSS